MHIPRNCSVDDCSPHTHTHTHVLSNLMYACHLPAPPPKWKLHKPDHSLRSWIGLIELSTLHIRIILNLRLLPMQIFCIRTARSCSYAHPRFGMRTLSNFTKVKVQKRLFSHKPRSQTNMWPGNEIQHKG